MIVRSWRGTTEPGGAERYASHLERNVIPELVTIDGFRRALVLRRSAGDVCEFEVLTFWDSLDAVRRFAGPDPEIAVIEPEAREVLTRFDPRARHFDVVVDAPGGR